MPAAVSDKSALRLGRRIQIVGPTGAGKSTLGHALATELGLPVIELDNINWLPNWGSMPPDAFCLTVAAALDAAPNGWVVPGNYFTSAGNTVIARADTVIWLNFPFSRTFPRLFRRTVSRAWNKSELWPGNPNRESWRLSFLSRESILLYGIKGRKRQTEHLRRALNSPGPETTVIELHSPKQVAELLASVRNAEVKRS